MSWRVLRSDRSLWVFTLVRGLLLAIGIALIVLRINPRGTFDNDLPLLGRMVGEEGRRGESLRFGLFSLGWFVSVSIGFLLFLPSTFISAALISSVFARMENRRISAADAFAHAASRFLRAILGYSLLMAGYGVIYRLLDEILGYPLDILLSFSSWVWIAITMLAIPALVTERIGPIASVRRSTRLFFNNRGPLITEFVLIWATFMVISLVVMFSGIMLIALLSGPGVTPFAILGLVCILLLSIGLTMEEVYNATIYVWITGKGRRANDPLTLLAGGYGFGQKQHLVSTMASSFGLKPEFADEPPPRIQSNKRSVPPNTRALPKKKRH